MLLSDVCFRPIAVIPPPWRPIVKRSLRDPPTLPATLPTFRCLSRQGAIGLWCHIRSTNPRSCRRKAGCLLALKWVAQQTRRTQQNCRRSTALSRFPEGSRYGFQGDPGATGCNRTSNTECNPVRWTNVRIGSEAGLSTAPIATPAPTSAFGQERTPTSRLEIALRNLDKAQSRSP